MRRGPLFVIMSFGRCNHRAKQILVASSFLSTCGCFVAACLVYPHQCRRRLIGSPFVISKSYISRARNHDFQSSSSSPSSLLLATSSFSSSSLEGEIQRDDDKPSDSYSLGKNMHWLTQDRFRVGYYYIWLYSDDLTGKPTSYEKYQITSMSQPDDDGKESWVQQMEIEMSSKFSSKEDYVVHHRMIINLPFHLLHSKDDKKDWKLDNFEYKNNNCGIHHLFDNKDNHDEQEEKEKEWIQLGDGSNVIAFEEKFDCFTMLQSLNHNFSPSHNTNEKSLPPYTQQECNILFRKIRNNDSDDKPIREKINLIRSPRHFYTNSWYGSTSATTADLPTDHHLHRLSGVAIIKFFSQHSFKLIEFGRKGQSSISIEVDSNEKSY